MKFLSGKYGWLLLIMLLPALVLAAEPEKPQEPTPLPGVIEIIPRLALLNQKAAAVPSQLNALKETESFAKPLEQARLAQEKLSQGIAQFEVDGWSFDRLLAGSVQVEDQRKNLAELLNAISTRLIKLDALRQNWQEQQVFWTQWSQADTSNLLKDQKLSFVKASGIIAEALAQTTEAGKPLVALQNEVLQLQQQNQFSLNKIEEMLQIMRGKTFEKTEKSFTSPDFYSQFNPNLLLEAQKNLRQVGRIDQDFLNQKGWVAALQLLLAVGLAGFIIFKRTKVRVSEEWRFIVLHPLATGVFVAVAVLGPLYGAAPGLLRLLLICLAAFSSAILVSGLLKTRCKVLLVYLMAALLVTSTAFQIIALPIPLYRLYLTLLCLGGVPFLLQLARRYRQTLGVRSDGFVLALRFGALILCLAFFAQFGGFSNLSSRLFESANKTVFLGLFTAMGIRLGRGGIDYLFGQPFFRRQRFFVRFGDELVTQLKKILRVTFIGYATLHLLVIWCWGIFESTGGAWSTFMQFGFAAGETRVTVYMVLLALVALYATVQFSWLLRALLDSEFFPRSAVDRGVRDSIKKLLHYSLMLIGFLFALSLLGITAQNFVVLAGAFGIGIGFGLQDIVNNFVCGLVLLFERPIKIGDMIMVVDEWAIVKKIGLRSTTIETFDLSEIIVPNSNLVSEKVTNWTLSNEQSRIVIPIGVAYGSDIPKVLEILKNCADKHFKVLESPEPSVLFTAFGASSLDFSLRVWVADVNHRLIVKSDLLQAIDEQFRLANVEIPFPQQDLHLRSIDSTLLANIAGSQKGSKV